MLYCCCTKLDRLQQQQQQLIEYHFTAADRMKQANMDSNRIVPHNVSGLTRYCLNITCNPGYEAVACEENDPYSTSCSQCQGDTYMDIPTTSPEGISCTNKRICSEKKGLIDLTHDPYDHVHNTLCRCLTEHGYQNPSHDRNNPSKKADRCLYCGNFEGRRYVLNEKCDQCPAAKHLSVDEYGHRHCTEGFQRPTTQISLLTNEQSTDFMVSPTDANGTSLLVISVVIPVAVVIAVILVVVFILYKFYPNKICRRKKRERDGESVASQELEEMFPQPALVAAASSGLSENQVCNGVSSQSLPGHSPVPDESMQSEYDFRSLQTNGEPPIPQDVEASSSINTAQQWSASGDDYKEKLRKNRVMMLKDMTVDEIFLSYLSQEGVISDEERQKIKKKKHSDDRAAAVVDLIMKRGPKAFTCLVQTLFRTTQRNIAVELDKDLVDIMLMEENEESGTQ